jgi:hypothetical protein
MGHTYAHLYIRAVISYRYLGTTKTNRYGVIGPKPPKSFSVFDCVLKYPGLSSAVQGRNSVFFANGLEEITPDTAPFRFTQESLRVVTTPFLRQTPPIFLDRHPP